MEEPVSITELTAQLNLSSRTLRHWESSGLFGSVRAPSGWRAYDARAVQRIRITMLLRRLDVPIRGVRQMLEAKSAEEACGVLRRQLRLMEKAAAHAQSKQKALLALVDLLQRLGGVDCASLDCALATLAADIAVKAEKELKEAYTMMKNSKQNEFRLIVLPPMRTVSYSCIDISPEDKAMKPVVEWIKRNRLEGTMRLFGYNTEPYPSRDRPEYGFGFCATVPEGVAIPAPMKEWRLPGGLYAAMNVEEDIGRSWGEFVEAIKADEEYEFDTRPCLEEHFRNANPEGSGNDYTVTLLSAVKRKK